MGEQASAMMDNVGNSVKQFANGDILEGYQTLSTNDQGEDWAATDKIDKATFRLVGKPTKKIIKTGNKLLNTKIKGDKLKDYLWYGKEYVKEGVQNSKVANFAKSKASNIAEKVGKSKLGTSAKNTISTIAETVGKDDGTFKKILSKIDDFGKMIAEKLGKKLGSKGEKCITNGVKYLKNAAGKYSKKIVSKVGGKLVKGAAGVASFGL